MNGTLILNAIAYTFLYAPVAMIAVWVVVTVIER